MKREQENSLKTKENLWADGLRLSIVEQSPVRLFKRPQEREKISVTLIEVLKENEKNIFKSNAEEGLQRLSKTITHATASVEIASILLPSAG